MFPEPEPEPTPEVRSFTYLAAGTRYTFRFPRRYHAGHQLTATEADALEQTRCENISDRCRRRFNAAIRAANGQLLSAKMLEELRLYVENFAHDYQFGNRQPRPLEDTIEREVRVIATERAEAAERQSGADFPRPEFEALVVKLCQSLDIRMEARRRIEIRQEIALDELKEMLS